MRNPYGRKEGGLSELVGTEAQDQPHVCTWLRDPHLHGLPTGFGYALQLQTKLNLLMLNLIERLSAFFFAGFSSN